MVYPKNKKQKSLLKSLLEEMKVRFELSSTENEAPHCEEDFLTKIDRSIHQAERGQTKTFPKDKQKEFLGV